jgi:hypothetical protein
VVVETKRFNQKILQCISALPSATTQPTNNFTITDVHEKSKENYRKFDSGKRQCM